MMRQWVLILAVAMLPLSGLAVESRVSGNMQLQGAYGALTEDDTERWMVETPNTWLGVQVTEPLGASRFNGVWQFDLDGLATEPEATTRQMYLEWQLPLYQLRAGRVSSLEQRFLVRPVAIMNGLPNGGSAVGGRIDQFSPRAFQFDISDGEFGFFSLEMRLDEPDQEASISGWTVAGGLDTPEGQLVLSYRADDEFDEAGLWGFGINWFQGGINLGFSYLYQDEPIAWDAVASYQAGSLSSKITYGQDILDDSGFWAFGFDQRFTEALRYYSEARRQTEEGVWLFLSGFRLSF